MATPPTSVQRANIVAYHLLLSLVNLLNLPLKDGTFIPRPSPQLHVLDKDVTRLRMLKAELDTTNADEVRGFLLASKTLLFELEVAIHQWPDLPRNAAFFGDLERLATLLTQARDLDDAAGVRDLTYKLSIMLPFFELEDAMRERNATAQKWFSAREGRRT